jgi:hypothetical protein
VSTVAQIDLDLNIVATKVYQVPRVADGAVTADLYAVERNVDAIRLELCGGRPDSC